MKANEEQLNFDMNLKIEENNVTNQLNKCTYQKN